MCNLRLLCMLFCLIPATVFAGDLEAPAEPTEAGSAMYTLADIYNRLNDGTAGAKRSGAFIEPTSGPASTGHTLDEVMGKAPSVDNTAGAGVAEVLVGMAFWGLTSGAQGTKTGTMPDCEGDNASTTQAQALGVNYFTAPEGYYDGDDRVSATDAQVRGLDANLSSDNIRSTVTIFGVVGNSNVVNTSTGDAVSGEIMKDKKAWADGSEVTGTLATQTLSPDSTTVEAGNYAATTLNGVDPDLATANIKKGATIFGVAGKTQVVDTTEATNPVAATRMKTDDVGFVNGNKITGTGTKEISATSDSVAEGYYAATTLRAVDTDLSAGNIRNGKNIFGVTGRLVDGSNATRVPKTGQTECWDIEGNLINCEGTGQDGEYQLGVLPVVYSSDGIYGSYTVYGWLGIRFTDNLDGTVTDNLTGLIWLKNAYCFGPREWTNALSYCNSLATGSCSLTDGSSAGDWRLPNINELHSLVDPTQTTSPALPVNYPFTQVQSTNYWSSTTYTWGGVPPDRYKTWTVILTTGYVVSGRKAYDRFPVWPVRSGN